MQVRVRCPTIVEIAVQRSAIAGQCVQKGIDKLIKILEDDPTSCFTAEEYMTLYTTTYNMCTQKAPHEYSEELYQRYRKVFEDYLTDIVRFQLAGRGVLVCCAVSCSIPLSLNPVHSLTLAYAFAGVKASPESGYRGPALVRALTGLEEP